MLATLLGGLVGLGGLASAWLPALTGAALLATPIPGAFGLKFGEPVAAELIGASIGDPPYVLPPENLSQIDVGQLPATPSGWHYFTPTAVPEPLSGPDVEFRVLLSHTNHPVRIEAELRSTDCEQMFEWVTKSLTKKYMTALDPTITPRAGFMEGARFYRKQHQVDVSCGRGLLLEYVDVAAFDSWRSRQRSLVGAFQSSQALMENTARKVATRNQLLYADTLTAGDKYRLDGALGLTFGESFELSGDYEIDTARPVELTGLPAPYDAGTYQITLGPDKVPIRVEGRLADGDGALFTKLSEALRTKYGTPMKDGVRHKIHKVDGDFFIVRRLERVGELNLVIIDTKADDGRKMRAKALARREFEYVTRGL